MASPHAAGPRVDGAVLQERNPYAPPEAPVEDPLPPDTSAITAFPRFSAWWVTLLTIITYAIYMTYWMYTRTQVLNRLRPGAIPTPLIHLGLGAFFLYLAASFASIVYPESRDMEMAANVATILSAIILLVWLFWMRSGLNSILGASRGERLWMGPVLTFFLQVIYLQYKINQAIDSSPGLPRARAGA